MRIRWWQDASQRRSSKWHREGTTVRVSIRRGFYETARCLLVHVREAEPYCATAASAQRSKNTTFRGNTGCRSDSDKCFNFALTGGITCPESRLRADAGVCATPIPSRLSSWLYG